MQETILITGSTDGIGLETAGMLAPMGHRIPGSMLGTTAVTEDILKWRRCSCDAPGFIELFCGAPRLLGLPMRG